MRVPKPPIFDPFSNDPATQADTDLFNIPSYLDEGFPAPAGVPVRPPLGYFNWLHYMATAGMRYLFQRGIPDWDTNEPDYEAGDIVRYTDGKFWVLMGTATTGLNPAADPTNWLVWLSSPRAADEQWAQIIFAWLNANDHKGFGLDHQGLPAGPFYQITEDWLDGGLDEKTVTDVVDIGGGVFKGSGFWSGRWNWCAFGNASGMLLAANGPWQGDTTTRPRGPLIGAFARATAQLGGMVAEAVKPWLFMPNTFVSLDAEFSVNPAAGTGTSEDESFSWGFSDGSIIAGEVGDQVKTGAAIFPGAYFYRDHDGTTWRAHSRTPAGASLDTDTTVGFAENVVYRGRIEIMGSNAADDGAHAVRFYIGQTLVATHLHSLANAKLHPFIRAQSSGSTVKHGLNLGPLRFTARHIDGPTGLF
jgi:hypothetical protein